MVAHASFWIRFSEHYKARYGFWCWLCSWEFREAGLARSQSVFS
jgi:hypothetical protein